MALCRSLLIVPLASMLVIVTIIFALSEVITRPLTKFLTDSGIPAEACVMKPDSTTVFNFPVKAPDGAVTRNDMSAIEQLELWKTYALNWCERKPSVTITVRDEEWLR